MFLSFCREERCSIQKSRRLRNLYESTHTSQKWSFALISPLMRFVVNLMFHRLLNLYRRLFALKLEVEFVCVSSQNGFDYLLTYSDDPQTVFPRYCVSWMVSSGKLFFFVQTLKLISLVTFASDHHSYSSNLKTFTIFSDSLLIPFSCYVFLTFHVFWPMHISYPDYKGPLS